MVQMAPFLDVWLQFSSSSAPQVLSSGFVNSLSQAIGILISQKCHSKQNKIKELNVFCFTKPAQIQDTAFNTVIGVLITEFKSYSLHCFNVEIYDIHRFQMYLCKPIHTAW